MYQQRLSYLLYLLHLGLKIIHLNSTFCFARSRAFFSSCFHLACGLLKIQAFMEDGLIAQAHWDKQMDVQIYPLAFDAHVFGPRVNKTTTWPHKNQCMHPPCNTILSLHKPIQYLPLHFNVHLTLKQEPFEVQDLGLKLNLQKNLACLT